MTAPSKLLHLGLDVDGVLANFNQIPSLHGFPQTLVTATSRDLFPRAWTPETWHWWRTLGYTESEAEKAWAAVDSDPMWWERLYAYAGVPTFLSWLRRADIKVTFITTRKHSTNAREQTGRWLDTHGYDHASVITTMGSADKGVLAHALHLDLLVDDYAPNLEAVELARHQLHVESRVGRVLYSRPWNIEEGGRYQRVGSLDQLQELLTSMVSDRRG